jgi:hypothetical protein
MGKILKEYSSEGTFVVLTDGQENSSKKYTKNHVKDLVEVSKLDVIYVGVDLDDAIELGIQNTLMYDGNRTPDMFRSVSESVSANVLKRGQSQPVETACSKVTNDSKTQRCTSQ